MSVKHDSKFDVMEKLRRLLRLADRADEIEAANAAQRAQEIMLRHGIEASDVEAEPAPIEVVEDDTDLTSSGRMALWRRRLACAVAEANGCMSMLSRQWTPGSGHVASLRLIGPKQKLESVRYLYSLLERMVDTFAARQRGRGQSYIHAYRHGLLDTLERRLEGARAEVAKSDCAAIILVDREAAATAAFAEQYGRAERPRHTPLDAAARAHGQLDGEDIPITPGLPDSADPAALAAAGVA